jgi:uncharacterized protein
MEIILSGDHFVLLPQRTIYWRERSALIMSDMHLGKAAHFRKEGIPVPEKLFNTDMQTLDGLVRNFQPHSLIIVGDMFHSRHNNEIELFSRWRKQQPLDIHLIKGNHDILKTDKYHELGIEVFHDYSIGPFVFSHHPISEHGGFCFSGHIHPGVRLRGMGRQNLQFPCFHFTDRGCTLPAFSRFTGLSIVDCGHGDKIYAIVGDEIMPC